LSSCNDSYIFTYISKYVLEIDFELVEVSDVNYVDDLGRDLRREVTELWHVDQDGNIIGQSQMRGVAEKNENRGARDRQHLSQLPCITYFLSGTTSLAPNRPSFLVTFSSFSLPGKQAPASMLSIVTTALPELSKSIDLLFLSWFHI
jgi:hypothetical protein